MDGIFIGLVCAFIVVVYMLASLIYILDRKGDSPVLAVRYARINFLTVIGVIAVVAFTISACSNSQEVNRLETETAGFEELIEKENYSQLIGALYINDENQLALMPPELNELKIYRSRLTSNISNIIIFSLVFLKNLGFITNRGIYFLGSFTEPEDFTTELEENHIVIKVGKNDNIPLKFRRTEKNMERFKEFIETES